MLIQISTKLQMHIFSCLCKSQVWHSTYQTRAYLVFEAFQGHFICGFDEAWPSGKQDLQGQLSSYGT